MQASTLPDTQTIHAALERAVLETLSVMFFADVNEMEAWDGGPPQVADGAPPCLCVHVPFGGAHSGRLILCIDAAFAAFCDESFEAREPGDEEPDGENSATDSVREMGNIICGSLLSSVWPGDLFQVEEPRVLSALPAARDTAAQDTAAPLVRTGLQVSTFDGNMRVEITINHSEADSLQDPQRHA